MGILEDVINEYSFWRNIIFISLVILFLCLIIVDWYFNKKNTRYYFLKVFEKIFKIVIAIYVGRIAYLFGIKIEKEYVYFNSTYFLIIIEIILLYGIIQIIICKKVRIPILLMLKNIKYVLFFELILLSITNQLEVIGGVVGLLAIVCAELIIEVLKKLQCNKKDKIIKESDYPNSELYYTRQIQLEKFIPILEQQKSEPYAVMISGEWGMGKNSFILALEKQFSRDYFIWIQVGSEKSVSEILSIIAEQIIDVLKRNCILIEREELIEKYFLAFVGLFDKKVLDFFNRIKSVFVQNTNENAEEYLNEKLKELKKLNKTIYLVVDDLDRCEEEYQLKMFKVIREITKLDQCKTIFLVDKNEFLRDKNKINYIEKYVNFTLDLCRVDYQEIVSYLIDDLFDKKFVEDMDNVLKKDRNAEQIKRIILLYPDEILESCNKKEKEINDRNSKPLNNEEFRRLQDIRDTKEIISQNSQNSRKVKNFLKGIKRDITILNKEIKNCGEEYKKEDWLRTIIAVQFLKNIIPNTYNSIKMSICLQDFLIKNNYDSINILLGIKHGYWPSDEKKITVLNYIIYKVDIIDFEQVKIESERYLSELHSEKATINNINHYIEYAQSYDDFNKVLEISMNQQFNRNKDREVLISKFLSVLSNYSSFNNMKNEEFLNLSKKLLEFLKRFILTEKEINICKSGGEKIIGKIIADNIFLLRNILYIFFKIGEVQKQWESLSISDINDLYKKLKTIDSQSKFQGLDGNANILLNIKTYFENIIVELRKEENNDFGLNIEEISREINFLFDICEFWQNIEYNLISDGNDMELANPNFYFDIYSFNDKIFDNVSCFKSALEELNTLCESKEGNYESGFSVILLRILQKLVPLYEENQKWFEGKESEISYLLDEIAVKIYKMEDLQEKKMETKDKIVEIKIYMYKIRCYCKNYKVE